MPHVMETSTWMPGRYFVKLHSAVRVVILSASEESPWQDELNRRCAQNDSCAENERRLTLCPKGLRMKLERVLLGVRTG